MATLTAEETELYDRQIRAWGFEAQKRYNFNSHTPTLIILND